MEDPTSLVMPPHPVHQPFTPCSLMNYIGSRFDPSLRLSVGAIKLRHSGALPMLRTPVLSGKLSIRATVADWLVFG